jgi:hypothetical protein
LESFDGYRAISIENPMMECAAPLRTALPAMASAAVSLDGYRAVSIESPMADHAVPVPTALPAMANAAVSRDGYRAVSIDRPMTARAVRFQTAPPAMASALQIPIYANLPRTPAIPKGSCRAGSTLGSNA